MFFFIEKKEALEDLDIELDELGELVNKSKSLAKKSNKIEAASSNPEQSQGFITNGPGFDPFEGFGGKKDEICYDWSNDLMSDYVPCLMENSTKFQVFFSILEETIKAGDRLLLFSQSLLTLNLLEEFLQSKTIPGMKWIKSFHKKSYAILNILGTQIHWNSGTNYFRLDGSTPAQERERLINTFNAAPSDPEAPGAVPLFIVSTRAGSLGINLVGANRVVVFDASWNPCHDSQAVCRVYR